MAEFKYTVNENFDHTFDEKGNTFLALRKVAWGEGEEKLDLRKWYLNSEGEEVCGKGFAFLTEEGPNELAKVLVEQGYGYTDEIINGIKDREDFMNTLVKVLNKSEDEISNMNYEEEYYDPTKSLLEE